MRSNTGGFFLNTWYNRFICFDIMFQGKLSGTWTRELDGGGDFAGSKEFLNTGG